VHAVLDSRGIQQTNLLLVLFSVLHMTASWVLIRAAGAVGLMLADAVNMALRIACSMW
jgi:oligosaccharide translocation protein RFT1